MRSHSDAHAAVCLPRAQLHTHAGYISAYISIYGISIHIWRPLWHANPQGGRAAPPWLPSGPSHAAAITLWPLHAALSYMQSAPRATAPRCWTPTTACAACARSTRGLGRFGPTLGGSPAGPAPATGRRRRQARKRPPNAVSTGALGARIACLSVGGSIVPARSAARLACRRGRGRLARQRPPITMMHACQIPDSYIPAASHRMQDSRTWGRTMTHT